MNWWLPLSAVTALGTGLWMQDPAAPQEPGRTILENPLHLGDDSTPEWPEASKEPDAKNQTSHTFQAQANAKELALEVTCRHVDSSWSLKLNGRELGLLPRGADRKASILPIPPNVLRDGENHLSLSTGRVGDDITFGPVRLLERGYGEIHQVTPLTVRVEDSSGAPLPARLTLVDAKEQPAPVHYKDQQGYPVRDGYAYTDLAGEVVLPLSPGEWTLYASRGHEWSVAEAKIKLEHGVPAERVLVLTKEVETDGWISVDTHVHTLTYSGHGDSSLEERVVTIAGEGLDVAIATDHNHHTDYSEAQAAAGMGHLYRSIVGNEVTTEIGHFNAFPMEPWGEIPDPSLLDWQELVAGIRAKGAKVVILNHPRWPAMDRGPFGVSDLDPRTGLFADGLELPVDAIEVFNSTDDTGQDWDVMDDDWFGLLNAGSRVRAVGSSDSHTVGDPVGLGVTWLKVEDDTPSGFDLEETAQAMLDGRASLAVGLFGYAEVDGQLSGGMVRPTDGYLTVDLTLKGASWARVGSVEVILNGTVVASSTLQTRRAKGPLDSTVQFTFPAPSQDAWLICRARGPHPEAPWWRNTKPGLALLTNPIWVDVDLDGRYSSPAETAAAALDALPGKADGTPQLTKLAELLKDCDQAVAVQVLVEAKSRWQDHSGVNLDLIPVLAPNHRGILQALLDE